jgi:hypothetical protein
MKSSKKNPSNQHYLYNSHDYDVVSPNGVVGYMTLIQHLENLINQYETRIDYLEQLPTLPPVYVNEESENSNYLSNENNAFERPMPSLGGGYTRFPRRYASRNANRRRNSRRISNRRRLLRRSRNRR